MIKNVKLTVSSILSTIILVSLIVFFGVTFGVILLIYFLIRIYKKLAFNKKNKIGDGDLEKKKVIDVDDDNYKTHSMTI